VIVHRDILTIKPTRCTNFSNFILEWNSTHSFVHLQEFFTVHTPMLYVIQVCWQLASRIRMEHSLYVIQVCRQLSSRIRMEHSVYVIQVCRQLSSRIRIKHPVYVIQVCRQLLSRIRMELYMFWTIPLPIIRSFSLYTQQWYMSYRFVDSFRAGSGWNSTCFRQFLCPSSGVFHCTHSSGICHTGL